VLSLVVWSGGHSQDWGESCECSRESDGAISDVSVVQRIESGGYLHPLQDGAVLPPYPHPTSVSFSPCVCTGVLGGGEQQQHPAAVH
jgi:hypothetical protein